MLGVSRQSKSRNFKLLRYNYVVGDDEAVDPLDSFPAFQLRLVCPHLIAMPPRRWRCNGGAATMIVLTFASLLLNVSWVQRTISTRSLQHVSKGSKTPPYGHESSDRDAWTVQFGKDPIDYDTSYSSCLLWMDDNFRLTEWIAFHYYMMNLRYIVVSVDERSRTSPYEVLDRWRDRITIVVWTHYSNFTDVDFEGLLVEEHGFPDLLNPKELIRIRSNMYVYRQVEFYQACAMHLRSMNRTWTSFHDVDEFLVVRSQPPLTARHSRNEAERPGAVARVVEKYIGLDVPNSTDPSDLQLYRNWSIWFSFRPCFTVPRAMFSAFPSSEADVSRDVPKFVNARRFDTLNWRYQATDRWSSDGPGKSIIDVSRLPENARSEARTQGGGTPHRPFPNHCTHSWAVSSGLPIVIHHYLGSWEEFSFRDDVRKGGGKTFQLWRDLSRLRDGGINDDAREWISGFLEMVGETFAKELLRDVGLPVSYRAPISDTEDWAPVESKQARSSAEWLHGDEAGHGGSNVYNRSVNVTMNE
jgi:hypothetical protein